ncbi:hypothetical protein FB446DRAFT_814016 [Lentinula raphanica]|nr:hypothetical protein FB446DRAFT_814016 [Lentinula raphanica]
MFPGSFGPLSSRICSAALRFVPFFPSFPSFHFSLELSTSTTITSVIVIRLVVVVDFVIWIDGIVMVITVTIQIGNSLLGLPTMRGDPKAISIVILLLIVLLALSDYDRSGAGRCVVTCTRSRIGLRWRSGAIVCLIVLLYDGRNLKSSISKINQQFPGLGYLRNLTPHPRCLLERNMLLQLPVLEYGTVPP